MGLSEKMEYIGGVLPRGIITHTITDNQPSDSSGYYTKTLLNIEGSGFLFSATTRHTGHVGAGYPSYANLSITIDGEKEIIIGGKSLNTNSETSEIKTDLFSPIPTKTIEFPIDCSAVGSQTINELIRFNKSLTVTYYSYKGASNNAGVTSSASFTYATT